MFYKQELYRVESVRDVGFEVAGIWEDDLHKIRSRLVLNVFSFSITELEVEAVKVPHEICLAGWQNINHLKGVNIGPGFNKLVNQMTSGDQGCSVVGDIVINSIKALIQAGSRQRPDWMAAELYEGRWMEWMEKYKDICIYFAQPDVSMIDIQKCIGNREADQ
jgi:Protein of unknown function (DUF2889).